MKKILLLIMMCALLPRTAGAQTPTDDTFTVSDLKTNPSGTYFDVGIDGSQFYCACNLDIFLPTGINIVKTGGKPKVQGIQTSSSILPYTTEEVWNDETEEMEEKKVYLHTVASSTPETFQLRVAVSSNTNDNFVKLSGPLFRVYVTIDESAFTSSFSPKPIVKLSNLNLTTSAAVKYVPADFACRPFTTGIPTSRTLPVNVSAENKIGTLILPFDAALPDGLKAYSCNGANGDLLTLTSANSIEACKPYIVYAENGYSGELSGTATLTDDANVTDIFADGYLTGVLTSTTVNTGYILQNQGSGPKFYDAEGVTFSLPAGRCYLTPGASSVKSFAINFNDEDSIDDTSSIIIHHSSILFDLSGRKVNSPTRGIYIQGTRKVVVK